MRTFFKWSGNKTQHLNKILRYLPESYNTYIEPFLGSGAMFLKLRPEKWIVGDVNEDLINIWQNVKYDVDTVVRVMKQFGISFKKMSKENKILVCRKMTERLPTLEYDVKRATVYILMTMCSYTGSILIGDKYYFQGLNMHITKRDKFYFLEEKFYDNLLEISGYLNTPNGQILQSDYKQVLKKAKRGDFVFLDPPYVEEHEYGFRYNKEEVLDRTFLEELLREVRVLDRKGVMWMMTQADTTQVRNIFKNYSIKTFPVYRAISKAYKNELVIMNY
jgi:DNA adenine methylase